MGITNDELKQRLRDAIVKYGADMTHFRSERESLTVPIVKELIEQNGIDEGLKQYNDILCEVLREQRILPPLTRKELN